MNSQREGLARSFRSAAFHAPRALRTRSVMWRILGRRRTGMLMTGLVLLASAGVAAVRLIELS